MKYGITFRLTIILALLGILISGLTGYYAWTVSRNLVIESAHEDLRSKLDVLAARIEHTRQDVARDLLELTALHDARLAITQQDAAAQGRLAELFAAMMQQNPAYLQVRLITLQNHGLELVRVDRDGNWPLRVTGDDLQEKGHFLYMVETAKLRPGQTYLSDVVINHEAGAHSGLNKPSAILGTPLADASGRVIGIFVINVDLNGLFTDLRSSLPPDIRVYLANHRGDFLIHPDTSRAFGFDRGQRFLLQDEFPETAALQDRTGSHVVLRKTAAAPDGQTVQAIFMVHGRELPGGVDRWYLGLAEPEDILISRTDQLRAGILQIMGVIFAACIVLAIVLARAITRAVNAMNRAVQQFAENQQVMPLPVGRNDEIGMLACNFERLQHTIVKQVGELRQRQQELEFLARHDTLTGLPNRRLFIEQLEAAVARYQRNQTRFALLFIDIDKFKQINDDYGHATGDAVLQQTAQRLLDSLHNSDSVARLGGDEFVILVESNPYRAQLTQFTEQLLAQLKAPIRIDQLVLQVEFSVGISLCPDHGSSGDALMASADKAMYGVKLQGRNNYRFEDDSKPRMPQPPN